MKSTIIGLVLIVSTFHLSYENNNHQDCTDAFPICEAGSYIFETMHGFGLSLETIKEQRCSQHSFTETKSGVDILKSKSNNLLESDILNYL